MLHIDCISGEMPPSHYYNIKFYFFQPLQLKNPKIAGKERSVGGKQWAVDTVGIVDNADIVDIVGHLWTSLDIFGIVGVCS